MNLPDWRSTAIFLSVLGVAALRTTGTHATVMASEVAWIVLAGLGAACLREVVTQPPRQWFRLDLAALAGAYYLTLAEFLAPQPQFAGEVTPASAAFALRLVLLGLAGLALGRHLVLPDARKAPSGWPDPGVRTWTALLWTAFLLANLHLFLSVQFNPVTLLRELAAPRFSQSWSRERLGDGRALLSEWQLLNYLIPPITAWLLTRRAPSAWHRALCALPFAFVLTISFCSGTRYLMATHAASFALALAWSLPSLSRLHAALLLFVPLALLLIVTVVALRFRHEGLGRTLTPHRTESRAIAPPKRWIVDNNVRTIAKLTETFPARHPYLGPEIPWLMLVRPIPRAFFPAKPTKPSLSMEEIIGIPQTTIAASFVGEGFLMAGAPGTFLFGLGLGMLCALWGRIPADTGSSFAIILHASGVVWTFLALRSPIWISVGLLPCVALWLTVKIAFPVALRLLPAQGGSDHGPPRL